MFLKIAVGTLSFKLTFGCPPGQLWAITERATGVNHCALSCSILQSLPCNGAGSHGLDKCSMGFKPETFQFRVNALSHCITLLKSHLKHLWKANWADGKWFCFTCLFVLLTVCYGQCFCLFIVCHFIVWYFPAFSTSTKSFFFSSQKV